MSTHFNPAETKNWILKNQKTGVVKKLFITNLAVLVSRRICFVNEKTTDLFE